MRRIDKAGLFVLLLLLVAGSCTQTEVEEDDIPPHALKDVEAGFNLNVLATRTPETRSVTFTADGTIEPDTLPVGEKDSVQTKAATALSDVQEAQVADVWIGQYDAATGNRLSSQYIGSMTDQTLILKLKQTRNETRSHVWFVANSGDLGEIATEKALKEYVLTYAASGDGLPSSGRCSMAGMWEGVVKEGGVNEATVNLTRLVAKITFTYAIGGNGFSFTPASVTLNTVPDRSQIVAPDRQLPGVTYKAYSGTANESGATMYWYLPENMVGTAGGTNAVGSEMKKTGKGVTNATYIELTGKAVQGGVTYEDVTFRFYPGSNNDPNNYDIIRNSHYKMNVNLIGIDVSDERITVGKIPDLVVDAEPMPAGKGGTKEVQVTARPGQQWGFEMPRWLSALLDGELVSGTVVTHKGPSLVTFQTVESNPKTEDRSVELPVDINGTEQKIILTQRGSTMEQGADISLGAEQDATGSSSFTATQGLAWEAALSGESWLGWATDNPATSGAESTGSAQPLKVRSKSPNPSAQPRSEKITVKAGASLTDAGYAGLRKEINITQDGSTVTGSTAAVNAEAANSLTASFTATPGLNWVASVADGSWITLVTTAGGPTTGAAEDITYNVTVNPNAASRTGNITLRAGDETNGPTATITVTQAASSFNVVAPTATIPADGSTTVTGSVTATPGLAWTISPETSNNITVSPISGKGDAMLTFMGTDNTGTERTGTFIVSVTGANPARAVSVTGKQETGETGAYVDDFQVCKMNVGGMSWSNANKYCSNLTTEGYSDWRLPSYEELVTMYNNRSKLQNYAGFSAFVNERYWSSKPYSSHRNAFWALGFANGQLYNATPSGTDCFVRCVRNK